MFAFAAHSKATKGFLVTFNRRGQWDVSNEGTLDSGLMKKSPLCWIS